MLEFKEVVVQSVTLELYRPTTREIVTYPKFFRVRKVGDQVKVLFTLNSKDSLLFFLTLVGGRNIYLMFLLTGLWS